MVFEDSWVCLPVAGSTATTPGQQFEASETRMRPAASTVIPVGCAKYWLEALIDIALDDTIDSAPVVGSIRSTPPQPCLQDPPMPQVLATRTSPLASSASVNGMSNSWLEALTGRA